MIGNIIRHRPRHNEENMQMTCVRWFDLQYPQYCRLLHHSPNGGKRNAREAARFKAMGTRAGFPDLILLVPRESYIALAIELKTDKGKLTELQKRMKYEMELQGIMFVVCRSFDEFQAIIRTYL